MAITRHTLTGAFTDPGGNPYPSYTINAFLETNLAPGVALLDTGGHTIQLGTLPLDLDPVDGSFSVTPVATDSADINPPTGVQYQVVVSYPDAAGNNRYTWSSGWFDLTADTTLDAVATVSFVPPNFASDFLAEAQALLDAQIDLSGIDDSDSEVATLISNGTLGPLTGAALSASIAAVVGWAKNPDTLVTGAVTRNSDGVVTSAVVKWPDGVAGVFTTDTIGALNTIDAYHITRVGSPTTTYTQPTITRDTTGAATNVPAIVVT